MNESIRCDELIQRAKTLHKPSLSAPMPPLSGSLYLLIYICTYVYIYVFGCHTSCIRFISWGSFDAYVRVCIYIHKYVYANTYINANIYIYIYANIYIHRATMGSQRGFYSYHKTISPPNFGRCCVVLEGWS